MIDTITDFWSLAAMPGDIRIGGVLMPRDASCGIHVTMCGEVSCGRCKLTKCE